MTIPNSIVHNGECFKLHKITSKKNQAIKTRKKLGRIGFRSRIKYFDQTYAVYVQGEITND